MYQPRIYQQAVLKQIINQARKIVVITGAGISVSAGIPDFRGPNGFYKRVATTMTGQDQANNAFDVEYFRRDPSLFYSVASMLIAPQQGVEGQSVSDSFQPTPTHLFIAKLERSGRLLRHYTQNIDGLDVKAGITRTVCCHGSIATFTCPECLDTVPLKDVEANVRQGAVAYCVKCLLRSEAHPSPQRRVALKPDVTFMGEQMPAAFSKACAQDIVEQPDLILIIGTSMNVAPVNQLPGMFRRSVNVPTVIINKDPVVVPGMDRQKVNLEIWGDCDEVLAGINVLPPE